MTVLQRIYNCVELQNTIFTLFQCMECISMLSCVGVSNC